MRRICLALDSRDRSDIDFWIEQTSGVVGVYKIGLTTFAALGPALIGDVSRHGPVFADLKLHDIPAQVHGAVTAIRELGCTYVTVHSFGGLEMIAAAKEAAGDVKILAVTVLTSLDEKSLHAFGIASSPSETVTRLARLALEAGADGLVCSPLEIATLRSAFGPSSSGGPLIVTPGIRSHSGGDDQRRTASGARAISDGADLIVVGRPITAAPDPAAAARSLAGEIDESG